MIAAADYNQIRKQGITVPYLEWQLEVFRKGVPFLEILKPATPGDGVLIIDDREADRLVNYYDSRNLVEKIKFVPASGAASRMFKALFEYAGSDKPEDIHSDKAVHEFFSRLKDFAFYEELEASVKVSGTTLDELITKKDHKKILKFLLEEKGLNYGNLPKGLIKFHRYENKSRTAFEEHLAEGALYSARQGRLKLHFTVSPEHQDAFVTLYERVRSECEKRFDIACQVDFSIQKASTDTIAVDENNHPFRNSDGSVLFRPGGHGALIDNLNSLSSDIVFIKNIDNVIPEHKLASTIQYKKILAGKLLEIQSQVFSYLRELDSSRPGMERLKEISSFIGSRLNYIMQVDPLSAKTNAPKLFHSILNRPIRVCGVVKNSGEPGGGPFWARNSKGDTSLQIIESSQVDMNDPKQADLFNAATHFNPVDLVCGIKTYKGEKFKLHDFVDRNTCFISKKSKDGKALKALELPGLWNGSMSDWITIFIEVPEETFNPVKTVNDLLRPQHQS